MKSTAVPYHRSLIAAAGAFLVQAVCLFAAAQDHKPEPRNPNPDPIILGEYGCLTGSEATFGTNTNHGVTLAVEQINAAGGINGRRIELKVYDTAGKTTEAGSAVTRLINQDHAVAVIGESISSLSIAGGTICQKFGVPMVTPSSTNQRVTQVGDMVFRICFTDNYQGEALARFAFESLKARKASILFDQAQAYSTGLRDSFAKTFTALGGKVETPQAYTGGDQNYTAQLTTIRSQQPDVLFIPGYYTDAGNIAIQARRLNVTAALLGGDGWDSDQLTAIGQQAIEGAYYLNHFSPDEQRPAVQEFVAAYRKRFDQLADSGSALGYDAVRIICDALRRTKPSGPDGAISGKALAAALAETHDFLGVTGTITIDKDRNPRKPAVIIQIKNGQQHLFTTLTDIGTK